MTLPEPQDPAPDMQATKIDVSVCMQMNIFRLHPHLLLLPLIHLAIADSVVGSDHDKEAP